MNVTLNITTAPSALPSGVVAGLLALSITDSAGRSVNDTNGQPLAAQQVSGSIATFNNVPAGDYIASATRLDSTGLPIGATIAQVFSVPNPAVDPATTPVATYDEPQTITVTLA